MVKLLNELYIDENSTRSVPSTLRKNKYSNPLYFLKTSLESTENLRLNAHDTNLINVLSDFSMLYRRADIFLFSMK